MDKKVLWKLYLRGRHNEYKLLGFVWGEARKPPAVARHPHQNLCRDVVKDTNPEPPFFWHRPWPKGLK